jgi:phage-related protein
MADSFSYAGTDCATLGLFVTGFDGMFTMADPKLTKIDLGGANGSVTNANFLKSKFGNMGCVVKGSSQAQILSRMESLNALFDSRNGKQALILDQITDRVFQARLNSPIRPQSWGQGHCRFTASWIMEDGCSFATSATTENLTIDETPETDVIAALGNEYATPVYTITQADTGGAVTVILNNSTTNESITWAGTLAITDKLRIDSARHVVEYSDDAGSTFSNAMSGKSAGGVFPRLQGGVNNTLIVTGLTDAAMATVYTARYI